MDWRKISDGDRPCVCDNVLVAFADSNSAYNELMLTMATYSLESGWLTDNGAYDVSPTDRWAYIDLPTD